MEKNEKITLTSMANGEVRVDLPEYRLSRVWPQKGAKVKIDKEVLLEAFYHPGLQYMLKHGILYIEDMPTKIELGLEPEDATEPQNIVILTDEQRRDILTNLPLADFKKKLESLIEEEQKNLAYYAIDNEIVDFARNRIMKNITGLDVIESIKLQKLDREDEV